MSPFIILPNTMLSAYARLSVIPSNDYFSHSSVFHIQSNINRYLRQDLAYAFMQIISTDYNNRLFLLLLPIFNIYSIYYKQHTLPICTRGTFYYEKEIIY